MNPEEQQSPFYRSLMGGLFAGIIAAVICLAWNLFYRNYSGFNLSDIINVSSIIFIVILVLTLAGLALFVLDKYFHRYGIITYMLIIIALTLLCVRVAIHFQRSPDPQLSAEFRSLFLGIIIISGAFASVLIPYMAKAKSNII